MYALSGLTSLKEFIYRQPEVSNELVHRIIECQYSSLERLAIKWKKDYSFDIVVMMMQ